MIDFSLSEDQVALKNLAHDFAEKEIRPHAEHYDQTGEFPWPVLQKAWELGLMNTHIPQNYGGLGLGVLDNCIIAEENAWGCTGIGTAMEACNLAQAPVIVAGNDDQKKRFLTPLTEKLSLAAYCVTEPGAGSDVVNIKTTATKHGNDYVLNGSKMWITNAAVADWYFVLAYTDKTRGHRGISAFVVPKGALGVTIGKKEKNLGQRASDTRGLTFDNVVVPKENLIGEEGIGFKIAMSAFDHTRPVVSASAVGLARAAMEHSIRYAKERSSMGKTLSEHQSISFMIADMAKDIEAARLLVWLSAWKIDQGNRNTREAAYAKSFAADVVMKVANDAVQIFGGYGYNQEYPVEKLFRDAKIFSIYEGTSQIQRLIIAKEIFSR